MSLSRTRLAAGASLRTGMSFIVRHPVLNRLNGTLFIGRAFSRDAEPDPGSLGPAAETNGAAAFTRRAQNNARPYRPHCGNCLRHCSRCWHRSDLRFLLPRGPRTASRARSDHDHLVDIDARRHWRCNLHSEETGGTLFLDQSTFMKQGAEGFAQQLGGQVERKSDSQGTTVNLILPIARTLVGICTTPRSAFFAESCARRCRLPLRTGALRRTSLRARKRRDQDRRTGSDSRPSDRQVGSTSNGPGGSSEGTYTDPRLMPPAR